MEGTPQFEDATFLRFDKSPSGDTIAVFRSAFMEPFREPGEPDEFRMSKFDVIKRLENLKNEGLPTTSTQLALDTWPE
jgi:hypothetical protein